MAVVESPETLGIRPFHEFDEANGLWPRGDRPQAIRAAAEQFRARFKQQGQVRAVKTVDLVAAGYPAGFAFGGAARAVNPIVNITNRLVIVQYEDFDGATRTLAWEPTVPEGSAEAPFYDQLKHRYGEWLSENVFATRYHDIDEAIAAAGIAPADVDYIAFDHLHVQDVRMMLGTADTPAYYPNARMLAQRREVDTFKSIHPTQWAWYVEGGMDGVPDDRVVLLDGDVEIGKGIALVSTPGHTDGNMSLCLNTPDGIWVSSENGVAADNWHPRLSKIPGVRRWAEFFNRDVVMNSNTLEDSLDQYDSMVKEHAIADPDPRDPRFKQVLPSSELAQFKRQWPVVPTHFFGGMDYGRIERVER
ncbi:MAG TPA: hypothetical protein VF520_11255 [Thermoleophilaceae bacterium]|jgi:hypothetical protein